MSQNSGQGSQAPSSESEVPEVPEMISDGKRIRTVWRHGDGDGDSSAHLVERSMNLVHGHPTWKILIDDLTQPIVRGSKDEPPHYVYLDDRACYAIYCSKAYKNKELRDFWPWDFNHQGNIKQGRLNRGHPAYLDDSCIELAQGRLRGKKWYTFYGAPDVTEYKPLRPKRGSLMEEVVAKEFAEETAADEPQVSTPSGAKITPKGTPKSLVADTGELYPSKPPMPYTSTPIALTHASRSSRAYRAKAVAIPPRSVGGSPYGESPPPFPHGNSPAKPGSLGKFNPRGVLSKAGVTEGQTPKTSPLKRQYLTPAEYSPPNKRASTSKPANPSGNLDFGGDGAQDGTSGQIIDLQDSSDDEPGQKVARQRPHQKVQPDAETTQLKWELEATQIHLAKVIKEREHFREVIVMLLASKISQQSEITERIIAFKKFTDTLDGFKQTAVDLVDSAKKEIEPTSALYDGLGTVLDGPGKHMYAKGMDEEWKCLQKDARKMIEAQPKDLWRKG